MKSNIRLFVVAGLLVGLGLALFVSPFASSSPDGLEKVGRRGGLRRARPSIIVPPTARSPTTASRASTTNGRARGCRA